jgi:hypothetical protein
VVALSPALPQEHIWQKAPKKPKRPRLPEILQRLKRMSHLEKNKRLFGLDVLRALRKSFFDEKPLR